MRVKRTLSESGSAPGVGYIHRDEIEATLAPISKFVGVNLMKQALGSVGKKQFSGDIDVAINIPPTEWDDFQNKLDSNPLFSYVEKTSVYITKIKIQNYDPNRPYINPRTKEEEPAPQPRTGFVQLDFMPGDPGWLKTYYHSPSEEESEYKGVFRNILLSTIAAFYDRQASDEQIADGRPVSVERWMWSGSDGLVRIRRVPKPKAKGDGYTKANINTIIGKGIKDAPGIAKALGLDGPEDLNSYESLKAAIEKNYPKELQDKIFQSFKDNRQVQDVGVPKDLGESNLHRSILKGLTEAYKQKVHTLDEGPIDFAKSLGKGTKDTYRFMKKAYNIGNQTGNVGQVRSLKNLIKPPTIDPKDDDTQKDNTPATANDTSGLMKGIMKGAALRGVRPNNLRSMPNGARFSDKTNKKYQYDKPNNKWFNIDDYKDELRGPDGFRLFQQSDKVFYDSVQFNDSVPLMEAEARIQHAEDLVFWEGSAGAMRAIQTIENLEKGGHADVTVKWDGSPAVIFGRNENGEFIFTDKSGFGAKGYDGRSTSADELGAMLSRRPGASNPDPKKQADFKAFIGRMTEVYPLFEKAVPQDYRGYFKGDMLYFDTPPVEDNHFTFKPNIVQYSIDTSSDLGKKIARSKAGVVIHRQVDENGEESPLQDADIFQGSTVLVVPPVTVEQPPQVDDQRIVELKRMVKQNASAIDDLLNIEKLTQMKMKAFPKVLYNYTNTKVDSGLESLGRDFVKWLDTVTMSNAMKQKIMKYVSENAQAFSAMWTIVRGIMQVKDSVIQQMEKTSSVRSNIPGHGEGGEGFVVAHPEGDIKLVGREFFTKANRAVER